MFLERVAMGARAIFPLASVSLAKREKTEKLPSPSPHTHLDAAKLGRGGGERRKGRKGIFEELEREAAARGLGWEKKRLLGMEVLLLGAWVC